MDFIQLINQLTKEFERDCKLETLIKLYKNIDFDIISKYHTLDLNFLAIFQDELDWTLISSRDDLTEEIIVLYHDLISWRTLKYSKIYTNEFKRQYSLYIKPTRQW